MCDFSEETTVGTMIRMVKNPAVIALAAHAGLDFVMFDMEHGAYSFETLADMALQASARGIRCFARVPELSKGHVSRALDCGVSGVMVPMIRNRNEALRLVQWAKYSPVGERGFSSSGTHSDYRARGFDSASFMEAENRRVLAIAQIELKEAIDDIEAIARTPGLDVLLIGPADLSNSLGVPGDFNHPDMIAAIGLVADACAKNNRVFGIHAPEDIIRQWIPSGLSMLMCDMEINMLSREMKNLNRLRV